MKVRVVWAMLSSLLLLAVGGWLAVSQSVSRSFSRSFGVNAEVLPVRMVVLKWRGV